SASQPTGSRKGRRYLRPRGFAVPATQGRKRKAGHCSFVEHLHASAWVLLVVVLEDVQVGRMVMTVRVSLCSASHEVDDVRRLAVRLRREPRLDVLLGSQALGQNFLAATEHLVALPPH